MNKYIYFWILGLFFCLAANAEGLSETAAARAVNVSGRVLVRKGEDEKTMRVLKQGDSIGPGDVVNTSSNSTLKLLFADQSIIDVSSTSVFIFDTFELKSADAADRKVGVSMLYGKIRASINKPLGPKGEFKVKTKSATMGVRGTEFIVSSDLNAPPTASNKAVSGGSVKGSTEVVVVKGTVAVDTPSAKGQSTTKPIDVSAGQKISTVTQVSTSGKLVAAEAPKVEKVSAQEMKTAQSEAKVQDNTFKQAVVVDPNAPMSESGGKDTLAIIGEMVNLESQLDVRMADFGFLGVFGPQLGFASNYVPPGLTDQLADVTVSFVP